MNCIIIRSNSIVVVTNIIVVGVIINNFNIIIVFHLSYRFTSQRACKNVTYV